MQKIYYSIYLGMLAVVIVLALVACKAYYL